MTILLAILLIAAAFLLLDPPHRTWSSGGVFGSSRSADRDSERSRVDIRFRAA